MPYCVPTMYVDIWIRTIDYYNNRIAHSVSNTCCPVPEQVGKSQCQSPSYPLPFFASCTYAQNSVKKLSIHGGVVLRLRPLYAQPSRKHAGRFTGRSPRDPDIILGAARCCCSSEEVSVSDSPDLDRLWLTLTFLEDVADNDDGDARGGRMFSWGLVLPLLPPPPLLLVRGPGHVLSLPVSRSSRMRLRT